MKWLQKILGITRLIQEQEKTNTLLEEIAENTKNSTDAIERYNKAYHI